MLVRPLGLPAKLVCTARCVPLTAMASASVLAKALVPRVFGSISTSACVALPQLASRQST